MTRERLAWLAVIIAAIALVTWVARRCGVHFGVGLGSHLGSQATD